MLRWLTRLALCSMLWHCGSSDSDGLFDSEDGASVAASVPTSPGSATSAAEARRPAPVAASSTAPLDEASAPASPASASPGPVAAPDVEAPAAARAGEADDPARADEPAPPPSNPADEPAASEPPRAVSVIQIERARWDEDDGALEVRGVVSSPAVTLSVRFLERAEPLKNEGGSFRAEFSAVEDDPEQITVTASDGASVTVSVEAN